MKQPGRPSSYTPQIAREICERLAAGESLLSICRDDHVPHRATIHRWILDDVEGFRDSYTRARELGLDVMADEILEIANTPVEGVRREESEDGYKEVREDMLGHRRLQVDARKWLLAKLAPKKYGDKQDINLTGQVEVASAIVAARKRSGG